jgi:hypothetical protein
LGQRKGLGSKGDGVTGGSRKLDNENLHNLYSSRNVIKMIKFLNFLRSVGHEARNCTVRLQEKRTLLET